MTADSGCGCLSSLCYHWKKRSNGQQEASKPFKQATTLKPPAEESGEPLGLISTTQKSPAPSNGNVEPLGSSAVASRDPSPTSSERQPALIASASDQISTTADTSLPYSNLWREAQEQVNDSTLEWVKMLPVETDTKDPFSEIIEIVRSKEEEHKNKALKLKVGKREILWRDYAGRVVSLVTAIGDIAIPFAPAPSSVIWSSVKVLLETNVTERQDIAAIMGNTEIVLRLVRRGQVYEEIYLTGSSMSAAQEDLRQNLVHVYKSCLEFLCFVDVEVKKGNGRRFLEALVNPGHGETKVSEMKELEKDLESAAHPCEAKSNEKHRKMLEGLEAPLQRVDDNVLKVLQELERKDREAAMKYISIIPVGNYHNEKREKRTGGTCEWLTHHLEFQAWEDSAYSSVLWLQGQMGTGKTFLSSKVIDRYWDRNKGDYLINHDEGFAFYYCSNSDPSRKGIGTLLRSYIRQLSEIPGRPDSVHKASYALYQKEGQIQHAVSVKDCEEALETIINSYPRTTLVLDALDECDLDTRRQFLNFVQRLIQNSKRLLKVFVASRWERDIKIYMNDYDDLLTIIPVNTYDNNGDIEKFIAEEMKKYSVIWADIEPGTKDRVKDALVKGSNGMFRWTYLQWEQLKLLKFEEDIEKRLKKLPETLEETYDEIMQGLKRQEFEIAIVQRAVRWVACARQAFDSPTLLAAIRVETEKIDGTKCRLTEDQLESSCRHLVVRDSEFGLWKFPHASVLDYFRKKDELWFRNCPAEVTIFMLNHMMECLSNGLLWTEGSETFEGLPISEPSQHGGFASTRHSTWRRWLRRGIAATDDTLDPRHPLQSYIQRNVFHHARDFSKEDARTTGIFKTLIKFFGKDGPQHSSREYRAFWATVVVCHWDVYHKTKDAIHPITNSIFGVIALGLHKALDGWWNNDLDTASLVNKDGEDLLMIAAYHGHEDACQELIEQGCDVNRQSNQKGWSALRISIDEGMFNIANLLLDNGAIPDRIERGHSHLCFFTEKGSRYVQLLLDKKANPNVMCNDGLASDCGYGCALSRAASDGDIVTLGALIENGAAVNPEIIGDISGSPLAAAVASGRLDCARFLVEKGAKVNAILKSGRYGSALAAATRIGDLGCTRFLVETGAEINVDLENGDYGSPLAAAASSGSLDCVQLLVERGAEINTNLRSGKYGSPLIAAVLSGTLDCVHFFVQQGADINAYLEFGDYGNALAAAVLNTSHTVKIVRFLIEERQADLTKMHVYQPRTIRRQRCFCMVQLSFCQVARYLIREHQIEADLLISMGFEEGDMNRSL